MMFQSGPIRLVRPSAVIITYFQLASGQTLENFIHKNRPRNVGCVHHSSKIFYKGGRVANKHISQGIEDTLRMSCSGKRPGPSEVSRTINLD